MPERPSSVHLWRPTVPAANQLHMTKAQECAGAGCELSAMFGGVVPGRGLPTPLWTGRSPDGHQVATSRWCRRGTRRRRACRRRSPSARTGGRARLSVDLIATPLPFGGGRGAQAPGQTEDLPSLRVEVVKTSRSREVYAHAPALTRGRRERLHRPRVLHGRRLPPRPPSSAPSQVGISSTTGRLESRTVHPSPRRANSGTTPSPSTSSP